MCGKQQIAAVFLILITTRGMAQEHQHGNGEKLGTVHFATSCNDLAQNDFDNAVALLHSFQFSRAIETFSAVLREDPTCGIAYWGIALSDWSNPFVPGQKNKGQLQLGQSVIVICTTSDLNPRPRYPPACLRAPSYPLAMRAFD